MAYRLTGPPEHSPPGHTPAAAVDPLIPPCGAGRQIFPFTVIDQAVHLLETRAEPWGIQLELGLTGHLDETGLRVAVGAALAAHPMARARQLPNRRTDRAWSWEVAPAPEVDPLRVVDRCDHDTLTAVRNELYSRPVPLVEAPPFRLVLVRRSDGDVLLLNANHAAFDGFGCVRLLQSIARAYTGRPDPATAVGLAEARDVQWYTATRDLAERARRFRMLAGMAADLIRRPARLAADGGRTEPGYGFHTVALSRGETERLTRHEWSSVNELLLAALTLAIAGWNTDHGTRTGRVGILVPVNLRPKSWSDDVVTNMVLEAQVLTRPAQRTDRHATLSAVAAQNQRIRRGAGAALIEIIGGWTSVPLWAKQPLAGLLWLTGNRLVPTALLSNLGSLGDPPDFGPDGGVTRQVWFSAPARMPCGLSIGAVTVEGCLHLSFRYRHPLLGPDATTRFCHTFLSELAALTET